MSIATFITSLTSLQDPESIKQLCQAEISLLEVAIALAAVTGRHYSKIMARDIGINLKYQTECQRKKKVVFRRIKEQSSDLWQNKSGKKIEK